MVYFVYLFAIFYAFYITKRSFHMLQENLYNENNRYLKWVKNNFKDVITNYAWFSFFFVLLTYFTPNIYIIYFLLACSIISCFGAVSQEREKRNQSQNKKPLVITKRIKRLYVTTGIIYFLPLLIAVIFRNLRYTMLLITTFLCALNYLVVYISMLINYPIEMSINYSYRRKAMKKLKSMPDLKVIGITGSYGKTSCKNILADILNIKYNCLPTPKSINTVVGLIMTINNQLSKFDDIFVAEMGAYVVGEIHRLCKLVNPKYGIITSIGTAHLETFGSEENIQHGKMELIEYLPSDGVGVLNRDDPKQRDYELKNDCKILWIGIESEDVDVRAIDIKCDSKGTSFKCVFKGDKKKYSFTTKLLGRHNVYNILSALALGYELGISPEELIRAVKRVKPIPNRLELKKMYGFNYIADDYNSNPVGAKSALDVLAMMDGYRVVVTPGMVELGEKQDYYNKEFGSNIADIKPDLVILVGSENTKAIHKGLIENGYKEKNIQVIERVTEAFQIINGIKTKKEIYALFENDLTDSYIKGGKK